MNGNNIRALQLTRVIEDIYHAEHQIILNTLSSLPRNYEMAALIELQNKENCEFDFSLQEELVKVIIIMFGYLQNGCHGSVVQD